MILRNFLFVLLAVFTVSACSPDGASRDAGQGEATADTPSETSAAEEIEITPGLMMKKLENGYGRAAMQYVIEQFKRNPACREIQTSVVPANTVAGALYRSLGFAPTGEMDEGEAILRMVIER